MQLRVNQRRINSEVASRIANPAYRGSVEIYRRRINTSPWAWRMHMAPGIILARSENYSLAATGLFAPAPI